MAMHETSAFLKFRSSLNNKTIEFDLDRDYIVGPSGSCVAMIRNVYPKLLSNDRRFSEVIARFTARVFEFTEFISNVIKIENFKGKLEMTVSYHDSCHALRELGLKEEPRNILRRIEGLKLTELPYNEVCCGFGGTFSVKFPEISSAMADEKLKNLHDTQADVLVSSDTSCLMHLEGRAKRVGMNKRFAHIAEIMAESIS